ncbi:MAG: metallophosphoesterase [Ignavibacteria bacterium]|jgi:predicted MPP superfamily phosphohydrolase
MRDFPYVFIIIFSTIIFLIDLYSYRGLRKLYIKKTRKVKKIIFYSFWLVPVVLISGLILFLAYRFKFNPSNYLPYFHFFSGYFILFYIPKLVFIFFNLIDDLIIFIRKIFKKKESDVDSNGEPITRKQFLTKAGIVAAGIPFLSIAYGIKWGRFNFTVRNRTLTFKNLPAAFNGFKIVQLSDFHLGSFKGNENKIREAVEIVNDQKPDALLFTGDFVNNVAPEVDSFINILSNLKAPFGKYSVLGNHDYGDYIKWDSNKAKVKNLENLKSIQREIGFDLLLNESRKIKINGEAIELLGVENWGLKPFPQYGDLNKALENTNQNSFKILMSHDPTHWDEQVLGKTNIDLTLSGHTHGAQFGIEIPGIRWSPVSLRYKRWGGLYTETNQKLYVNTGIGFIGFPGRVGMPPEITVIELRKG